MQYLRLGSVAVILPPLMGGSTCVSSLRPDLRKLEDKFANHRIELRDVVLNLEFSAVHGNRGTSDAFTAYLAVLESSLPSNRPGNINVTTSISIALVTGTSAMVAALLHMVVVMRTVITSCVY